MSKRVRGRSWLRPDGDRVYGTPFRHNRDSLLRELLLSNGLNPDGPGGILPDNTFPDPWDDSFTWDDSLTWSEN